MGEIDNKIVDAIKQILLRSRITSQSFGKENEVIEAGEPDTLGIDDLIGVESTDANKIAKDQETDDAVGIVKLWNDGNIDEINKFGSKQMGNLRSVVTDPFGFFVNSVFGRFAKGAGVLVFAGLIFEAVKFIVEQLFGEGRPFDIRFRERIDKQVVLFLERREQAELRQGFAQVITTTFGTLRGGAVRGQVSGNFYNPERIPPTFLDNRRIVEDNPRAIEPETIGTFGLKPGRRGSGGPGT